MGKAPKLTDKRLRILRVLRGTGAMRLPTLNGIEIGTMCGEGERASHWAQNDLRELARHELVKAAGMSRSLTWRITEAGLAALKASDTPPPEQSDG